MELVNVINEPTLYIKYAFEDIIPFSFEVNHLYDDDITVNIDDTLENGVNEFSFDYGDIIDNTLNKIGMRLLNIEPFYPETYNNGGVNLIISSTIDKDILREEIIKNKEYIQKLLDRYIPKTVYTVDDELENLNKDNYEPDILVLKALLDTYIEWDVNMNDAYNLYHYLIENTVYYSLDEIMETYAMSELEVYLDLKLNYKHEQYFTDDDIKRLEREMI